MELLKIVNGKSIEKHRHHDFSVRPKYNGNDEWMKNRGFQLNNWFKFKNYVSMLVCVSIVHSIVAKSFILQHKKQYDPRMRITLIACHHHLLSHHGTGQQSTIAFSFVRIANFFLLNFITSVVKISFFLFGRMRNTLYNSCINEIFRYCLKLWKVFHFLPCCVFLLCQHAPFEFFKNLFEVH